MNKIIRHVNAAMFLLCSASPGFAQDDINPDGYNVFFYGNGETSSEGSMKNGKPEGYWKNYYENGVIKSEGNRVAHELEGLWKFYDEAGRFNLEINFAHGVRDGYFRRYNEQGILVVEEFYSNGFVDSISTYFDEAGRLIEKVNYKEGKRHGKAYRFAADDGRIISIKDYNMDFPVSEEKPNRLDAKGKRHGVWREFYENGKIKWEGTYKDDKKDGFFREYTEDGNLIIAYKYYGGVIVEDPEEFRDIRVEKEYYPDAKIKKEVTFVNGVPHGVCREFSQEGKIMSSKIYRNGYLAGDGIIDEKGEKQGNWKEFHYGKQEKGRKTKAEGNYINGMRDGKWTFYYEDGSTEQKGVYKMGKPDGLWMWYYENGKLLREEEFTDGLEDGHLVEYNDSGTIITKGYYEDGRKERYWISVSGDQREEGAYVDDRRSGIWKYYYTSEKLRYEGEYVDGEPHGRHVYYYDNGVMEEEREYLMGVRNGEWKKYNRDGSIALVITYDNGMEVKYGGVKVKADTTSSPVDE